MNGDNENNDSPPADFANWRDALDERQQKDIDFCGVYTHQYIHGAPDHSRMVLVTVLTHLLDAFAQHHIIQKKREEVFNAVPRES